MIDVNEFVSMINEKEEKKVFKLGTIVDGKVKFDGEDSPSEKNYTRLGSYTTTNGDRVLLALVGGTYVILGDVK